MRRNLLRTVVLLALVSIASDATAARSSAPDVRTKNPYAVPGQFIVGFRQGVSATKQKAILGKVQATTRLTLSALRARLVTVPARQSRLALSELSRNANVRYAEPNFLLRPNDLASGAPNDPFFANLWGLKNTGQIVNGAQGLSGADADVAPAWSTSTGKGVVVAVIDSGVDFSHPDLGGSSASSGTMWINPGENCGSTDPTTTCAQRSNGLDDDGDGYVDDWRGWDFANNDNDPTDDVGHGTHVTGTIAATADNNIGVVGIAPGVKIMALKFISPTGNDLPGLPAASGTAAGAAAAVLYAVAHGARIINASFGSRYFSQALFDAFAQADAKGVLVAAAAGNWGFGFIAPPVPPTYPAAFELPNIISVAAQDSRNRIAEFSFWGDLVDLAAPGVNIESTWPAALAGSCSGTSYCYLDGTSMAAPHVAGTAALLIARQRTLTAQQVKAIILGQTRPIPQTQMTGADGSTWQETTKSGGAVDAARTLGCFRPNVAPVRLWLDRPARGFIALVNHRTPVVLIGETCPPGGTLIVKATVNGVPVNISNRGDGVYAGAYFPTAVGPLAVDATATTASGAGAHVAVAGRASRGYDLTSEPYQWIDVPSIGKDSGLRSALDGVTIPLPFPFAFYGTTFKTVTLAGKGWLTFGQPLASPAEYWWPVPNLIGDQVVPSRYPPDGFVAPLWTELSLAVSGAVWYGSVGTAPHRRFIAAWTHRRGVAGGKGTLKPQGVAVYSPDGTTLCPGRGDFEVILDEATNVIHFEYQNVAFGCDPYGGDAVIGVENFAGDVGSQFAAWGWDPSVGQAYQPVLKAYERKKGLRFSP